MKGEQAQGGGDDIFRGRAGKGVSLALFTNIPDHLVAAPGGLVYAEWKHLRSHLPGSMLWVGHGIEDEDGCVDGCGDMGCDSIDADEQAAAADQGRRLGKGEGPCEGIDAFATAPAEIVDPFPFGGAAGNEEG